MFARKIPGKARDQALRLVGIRGQHPDDVLHRHGIMIGVPAIEIGDHGNGGVTDLRLAGELGLGHIGHADHGIAEVLIGHAFGIGRELRTFHADIGAAARNRDTLGLGGGGEVDAQPRRHRMRHRYVRHAALAEERAFALVSTVDKLVNQHKGSGRQFLLERAAGRQRDQVRHTRTLQHVDVGAVIDVGWREPMTPVMAWQKHDRKTVDRAAA